MKSSLYCELTSKELSDIMQSALRTSIDSARLLTGGLFNTTYLVDTTDGNRVVLRAGPVNRHLLMPFEHRLMETEEHVYRLCSAQQSPVSQVLAIDTSKKRIDRDIMIVRYIPSKPMNETNLDKSDKVRISRDIGEAVAKMHRITAQRFGRITDVTAGGGFSHWSECLKDELRQWEKVAVPTGLYSETEHLKIRTIFDRATPLLDEIHIPCLIHTDLWAGNLLISNRPPHPEFAAIIDADRALWGDPDFEFSSIQWMLEYDTFWEGYGRRLSQDVTHRTRRDVYHLLFCLWNSYVYWQEYNNLEEADAERAVARELIAGLIQAV